MYLLEGIYFIFINIVIVGNFCLFYSLIIICWLCWHKALAFLFVGLMIIQRVLLPSFFFDGCHFSLFLCFFCGGPLRSLVMSSIYSPGCCALVGGDLRLVVFAFSFSSLISHKFIFRYDRATSILILRIKQ